MRKLRVLVLVDRDFVPPESLEGVSEKDIARCKTEYDVTVGLEHLGHDVRVLGVSDDIAELRRIILDWKPHIAFNLLEEFREERINVPYVLGFLELMNLPYTGCNPSAMIVAENKPMVKKILRYHRVPSPDFMVCPRGKPVRRPPRLEFPLIVKSAGEHGSIGIAHASVVHDDAALAERAVFIHNNVGTAAIAERYIDGREVYLGVVGNRRLMTLPIWELMFASLPEGAPRIATQKVKWDQKYQVKVGLSAGPAGELPEGVDEQMRKLAKRVYKILGLSGYCRMDFRVREDGKVFVLEPNPNPDLAHDDEFAESALAAGIEYEQLLQRILNLGLRYEYEGIV